MIRFHVFSLITADRLYNLLPPARIVNIAKLDLMV